MKNIISSWQHYSKTERIGITALVMLSIFFLVLRFTMDSFVSPTRALQEDPALTDAWSVFQMQHTDKTESELKDQDLFLHATLFPFDPNTLDSNGFTKLGLRAKTTHLLLNWRRKGKVFYKKEEFRELYTLREDEYARLSPYITISHNFSPSKTEYAKKMYIPAPESVDINTTDVAALVKLRGIGPFFAQKIIERRDALGGYLRHEQLLEAYRFPDTTFEMLKGKLVIQPGAVRKINLNTANEEQLQRHPYIGQKMAKNILLYRDAMKRFEKIEQLRQVPLMNEEIYRKIAPYLIIE
ncbi:MAG TPA: helix-hairpin-helix domain-containing protein [Flavipsychrobacter sp.]|nr:helix-hairpin-helix domain-containing protein [Flavipsychrobacter sp.]